MKQLLIVGIFILFNSLVLHSQETRIIVRAKAKDAKFIGTSIGGAYVIIKDANTGKTLAEGLISGSTGNTDRIMKKAHERHVNLSDDQTAKFHTTPISE